MNGHSTMDAEPDEFEVVDTFSTQELNISEAGNYWEEVKDEMADYRCSQDLVSNVHGYDSYHCYSSYGNGKCMAIDFLLHIMTQDSVDEVCLC